MVTLNLKIQNAAGEILAESTGEGHVELRYIGTYAEGDQIVLTASEHPVHLFWQVDDALGSSLCYLTKDMTYPIPFGEKKRVYSPNAFAGERHFLFAEVAEDFQIHTYRNLAVNVADQHRVEGCYPHADANVETRGESVFEAKNAIDGVCGNHGHGNWPFASWGINRDPNACMKLDFGRSVEIDRLGIRLRADFPHDSYWTQGTVTFSDGSVEVLQFRKTDRCQYFAIAPRTVQWLTFDKLIKAEDESPFPALTQIEVYGKDPN